MQGFTRSNLQGKNAPFAHQGIATHAMVFYQQLQHTGSDYVTQIMINSQPGSTSRFGAFR